MTAADKSPFERLLGAVAIPHFPAGTDYRDVSDAVGDAIVNAARLDPDHFFAVLAGEPSLWDRSDLVWSLGFVKDPRAIPVLVTAMRSKNSSVRWAAANSLSHYRHATVVDALIAALGDRSSNVRDVVIEALGGQGSKCAIDPLRAALARPSNRKSEHTRESIEAALDRLERK